MTCRKEDGCPFWDDELCNNGRCPCDEEMTRAFGFDEWEDKLDKPATEISVLDVYSPSELL